VTQLRFVHYESLAALRANAVAWDDLWLRSDATLPSLRAELLAQWVEQFARSERFHAIGIEAEGRLLAALPLVGRRIGRFLNAGAMPSNEWSASGELLYDSGDSDAVLDALTAAIREVSWPLLWLDEAVLDAPRWQQLRAATLRARMTVANHPRWCVGRVAIAGDWPGYKANWSRKHRQKMAWAARRLARQGEVRLVVHSQLASNDVAAKMRQAFELEDRGWKGAAGTSVLQSPGMADFFIRQAEQAARWGQLELVFLECGSRTVAFSYGLSAKGVFHSIKVGYDPEFAEAVPGQLLRYYLLERLFAEPGRKALDFQGPMTEAHAVWLPETYTIGRMAVAPGPLPGRLAVWAYRALGPCLRRFRRSRCLTEQSGEGRP
jgi:CelD/BcsL family acetyltransferase involved in cellulose biosynthesis